MLAYIKKKQKQVIAVVSVLYSGSTLLTAILGAHSKIMAAGEVRWLIEKNGDDLRKMIEHSKKLTNQKFVAWQDKAFESSDYGNVFAEL